MTQQAAYDTYGAATEKAGQLGQASQEAKLAAADKSEQAKSSVLGAVKEHKLATAVAATGVLAAAAGAAAVATSDKPLSRKDDS